MSQHSLLYGNFGINLYEEYAGYLIASGQINIYKPSNKLLKNQLQIEVKTTKPITIKNRMHRCNER